MSISRRHLMTTAGGISLAAATSLVSAGQTESRGHVVLLGDSIFDNKPYVGDGPAVIEQVDRQLGPGWKATLLAVDGSVTGDVRRQLDRLPDSATHLVLSVGGNDALMNQGFLEERVNVSAQALSRLAALQARFGKQYDEMLELVLSHGKPTVVCTVYDPSFDDPARQRISVAALSVFNDRITRSAFSRGLPVIDLRLLFTAKDDYANPIEPGPQGGLKIAKEIARIVRQHDFSRRQSTVYRGTE